MEDNMGFTYRVEIKFNCLIPVVDVEFTLIIVLLEVLMQAMVYSIALFRLHVCSRVAIPLDTGDFTVLSYNILADRFAVPHKFDYCPPWVIVWPYRRRNLLEEITAYNADIICLQEVQSDDFDDILEPLTNCGYFGGIQEKEE